MVVIFGALLWMAGLALFVLGYRASIQFPGAGLSYLIIGAALFISGSIFGAVGDLAGYLKAIEKLLANRDKH